MKKRGKTRYGAVIKIILAILIFAVGIFVLYQGLKDSASEEVSFRESIIAKSPEWSQQYVRDFLLEGRTAAGIEWGIGAGQTIGILASEGAGFNRGFWTFISQDFWIGLLAGILIWAAFMLIGWTTWAAKINPLLKNVWGEQNKADRARMFSSWLYIIGNHPLKAVLFAVFYAVLLQIPVLNRIIQLITFAPLVPGWVQGFIVAIYAGFLPAFLEARYRYKIRKKLSEQVLETGYGGRAFRGAIRKA